MSKADKKICAKAYDSLQAFNKGISFTSFYEYYQKYGKCQMDGAFAEEHSIFSTIIFFKNWDKLGEFAKLIKKTPGFKKYVLAGVNVTVTGIVKESKQILKNTKEKCPKGHKKLCSEIHQSFKSALDDEMKSY